MGPAFENCFPNYCNGYTKCFVSLRTLIPRSIRLCKKCNLQNNVFILHDCQGKSGNLLSVNLETCR